MRDLSVAVRMLAAVVTATFAVAMAGLWRVGDPRLIVTATRPAASPVATAAAVVAATPDADPSPADTSLTDAAIAAAPAAAPAAPPTPPVAEPARAMTGTTPSSVKSSDADVEQRGFAALALLPFAVERTGYDLIFAGPRDGYLGLTSTTDKTITIYIRSGQTSRQIAKVIAHEVGHAIDVEFTTEEERTLYRAIRGIDGRAWYPDCSGCTDYGSVAGDFAETFAVSMVGDVGFLSMVAPAPTAAQLAALASIFTV